MRMAIELVGILSTLYAAGLNLTYLALWPLARRSLGREVRRREWTWYEEAFASPLTPAVSILVAAYNEHETVIDATASLLAQRYPSFELVVVDDGSTDDTAARLIAAYGLERVVPAARGDLRYRQVTEVWRAEMPHPITLIRKPNGGRADALNCALDVAEHPYVCVTDADSILDPDALSVIVRPVLEDPERVISVGGTIRIANSCRFEAGRMVEARVPRSRLAAFQTVEYLRAFLFGRMGWDAVNSLMIVSGAFGLFRRDVLLEAGGYWADTVGEDLELTIRLHRHMRASGREYRIAYAPDPICWTEVPEDAATLGRQRRRWHRGLWESLWRHRSMFGRPRFGVPGMVALPYLLVFEFCGPLIEALAWVMFPIGLAYGMVDPRLVAAFVLCAWVLGTLTTVAACALEETGYRYYQRPRELARLLVLALFENLGYRQLIDGFRLAAVCDLLLRRRSWGRMERRGFGTV
jgi:cellulose synthase/poly-beta-1,6-N-acetylglucosamine synthase-like glycosyltransferase